MINHCILCIVTGGRSSSSRHEAVYSPHDKVYATSTSGGKSYDKYASYDAPLEKSHHHSSGSKKSSAYGGEERSSRGARDESDEEELRGSRSSRRGRRGDSMEDAYSDDMRRFDFMLPRPRK